MVPLEQPHYGDLVGCLECSLQMFWWPVRRSIFSSLAGYQQLSRAREVHYLPSGRYKEIQGARTRPRRGVKQRQTLGVWEERLYDLNILLIALLSGQ